MTQLYNTLLDSDQFHENEITLDGDPAPIPTGVSDRGIPFGGHQSTALNAVNFIKIDFEAAAKRNIGYIRENIARRLTRENSVKEIISPLN